MPKEVLDLRNFSGGLNNNTNPRDLDTSEFQELKGFSIETPGKLKISGAVDNLAHTSSSNEERFASTLNHGNGLFHFNTDRDPDNGALSNTELLLINDIPGSKVKVFDKTDGAFIGTSEIDYGTTATTVDYYAVDGQVRVSANNQDNTNNQNKWYGYINRVFHYGNDDVDVHLIRSVNGFNVDNAYPSPLKSGAHSAPDGYGYQVNQLQNYQVGNTDFLGAPNNQTELLFNRNAASWSVAANEITPTGTNKLDTVATALNASYTGWSSGYGPLGLYMWFDPADQNTADQTGADINVFANSLNKKYSIWVTNIYDDQESNATHVGYIKQPPTLTADRKRKLYWSIIGRIPNKKRQTGFKVYWALDDDDVVGIKYLFMEIDFEKGIRQPGTDVYVKLGQTTHNNSGAITLINNEKMFATGASFSATNMQSIKGSTNIQELSILEPYIERGYNPLGRAGTWFKTSVILNRRAYIGNIRYYDENNKLQTANDTVLKSEVNQFDTFDREKRLDVEINDGDDIIKLASVGSKLLEFKRNSLFIINCSRDQELLEATLKYKGCEKDYHVVQAEGFVAWFNKYGVFLYDGEQLRDLLIGPTGQKRFKDWNTQYYSDDAVIGYVPDKQTLIIANPAIGEAGGNPSGGILEIDLKTLGWAYSALKANAVDVSNFVNVNDGKLVWYEQNGSNIELKYWNPEPALKGGANTSVLLKTAAFDFEDPSRDKTITTVYINYKNGEDITVKGFTDVAASNDGSAFNSVTLGTLAGNNDTTNRVAKFKVRGITSAFKKVKTFGIELSGNTDQEDFEINDMQIVHRIKTIK